MLKYLFTAIVLFGFVCTTDAQTCCSGGVPVSSNIGLKAEDDKSIVLSISADFNTLRDLYNEGDLLDDDLRSRTTQSYILRGAYSWTSRLSTELFFPLVRQTRNIITNSGADDFQSSFGVGDPILMMYYDMINTDVNLTIGAGPQIPLGSFSKRNNRGLLLVEDLQPGSGAWDFVYFSSLSSQLASRPSMSLFARAIYSMTGTNNGSRGGTQSYTFGDDIQLIAGISDQLLIGNTVLGPAISLRYRNAARDRVDGNENTGTGGQWLFARASVGFDFIAESAVALSLEVPVSTFVNETQLSPTSIFNITIQKSFSLSKSDDLINF